MTSSIRKTLFVVLVSYLAFAFPASAAPARRLSFVIEPSTITAGSSLFAATILTPYIKNLNSNNAVVFQVLDRDGKAIPGTAPLPVTTDSNGVAVFADTVLRPGRGYVLVAGCGDSVLRSRPFDVLPAEPESAPAPLPKERPPVPAACPPAAAPAPRVVSEDAGKDVRKNVKKDAKDAAKKDAKDDEVIVIPNPLPVSGGERYPY